LCPPSHYSKEGTHPTVEWLFLDLNSYFASVEQQERPELRGRPIGIVPLITENTCCIAASYEAKAYGIKTGTSVADAKLVCPHLQLVEGRPKLYVEYHHRITEAVQSCIPISHVMSIDEMACRLMGRERFIPNANAIAYQIKEALRKVATPTLVIHGDEDPILPLPHGRATADAIPGAKFLVIEGMGHDISPRAQKRIAQAILEHTAAR